MKMESIDLRNALSKNRAEELGEDVWLHFVIPPFFEQLGLKTARKSQVIIGGRGCGKTMLLRYLSHHSVFSPKRVEIPEKDLEHIGLYWRADTQFTSVMNKRGLETDVWQSAFAHMAAVVLGIEVLDSLYTIANSKSLSLNASHLRQLNFKRIKAFAPFLPDDIFELKACLEEMFWKFETWVNNIRSSEQISFLPGIPFVKALIEEIQRQIPNLKSSTFFVYMDEYENLCEYQQRLVNTWLKHSQSPLIFNLAMKRNAFETKETTGLESISHIHDYRQHDLDDYFTEPNAGAFFAEILFLNLHLAGVDQTSIDIDDLRDPNKLQKRTHKEYCEKITKAAEALLPALKDEELAMEVFRNKTLSRILEGRIKQALENRRWKHNSRQFWVSDNPQATIIMPALISRMGNKYEDLLDEISNLKNKKDNKFTGRTNWIHNNFIGCLLQLYQPYNRTCPFYAGFKTFLQLSRGNIRHFLELCNKSINTIEPDLKNSAFINPHQQAEAAHRASTAFLGEVKSFGPYGSRLHTFLLWLGSLFALAHSRPTQSETEQSHFSVVKGSIDLDSESYKFLLEASKWSVLIEEEGTKKKDKLEPESIQYVLNPIYAPYFHISYRKKRRLEIRSDDLKTLIDGNYDEVRRFLKRMSDKWKLNSAEMEPTLFSHLNEG